MIDEKTALILGAGASSHASYEVGPSFKSQICALANNASFLDDARGHSFDDISDFLKDFTFSAYRSPDRFLEDFPAYERSGKLCIAGILLRHELDSQLFKNGSAGWYETLFESLEMHAEGYNRDNVSIVTFNYDRSLEHTFWRIIEARHKDPAEAKAMWENRPEIIHVHGMLGGYDPFDNACRGYELSNDFSHVVDAAEEIIIVSEADPTTREFQMARDHLIASERILFLGFGFDARNVARLAVFDEEQHCAKVGGTFQANGRRNLRRVYDDVFGSRVSGSSMKDMDIRTFMDEYF